MYCQVCYALSLQRGCWNASSFHAGLGSLSRQPEKGLISCYSPLLLSSLCCLNPPLQGILAPDPPAAVVCDVSGSFWGAALSSAAWLQGGRKRLGWESIVALSRVWEAGRVLQTQESSRFWQGRACLSWSRSQRSYQVTCLLAVWNTSVCRFRSALALPALLNCHPALLHWVH